MDRPAAAADVEIPGHAWVPNLARTRLSDGPVANLKLASGCDRRCAFCAIPSFRGSFVSRPPDDMVAEAAWLGMHGVRELVLVSENSTSYGKDLPGGTRALTRLLPRLAQVPGVDRVRLSYLQPAELRPDLLEVIAGTPGVAPYFDLSFQHASPAVLRRMRRFGSRADFLELCARIRALAPEAGIRSNVIVGFPGETEADLAELEAFLSEARLDAVGVFGYSDEDGTEAAGYPDKVPAERGPGPGGPDLVAGRRADLAARRGPGRHRGRGARRGGGGRGLRVHRAGRAPGPRGGRRVRAGARLRAGRRRPGARGRDRHRGRGPRRLAPRAAPAQRAAPGRWRRAPARREVERVSSAPAGQPPLLNIANVLTGLRLLLVPVFLAALFVDGGTDTRWRLIAFGCSRWPR